MGTGSFQGVKRPWRGIDHPHLSTAEVKERVGLYLRSPSAPSWPVLGWTLPLLDENSCESSQNASRNTWISAECQLQQRVFWEPYWVTQGPITLLSVIAICSRNVTWNTIIFFIIFTPNSISFRMSHPARGTSNLRAEHRDFVRMSLGAK